METRGMDLGKAKSVEEQAFHKIGGVRSNKHARMKNRLLEQSRLLVTCVAGRWLKARRIIKSWDSQAKANASRVVRLSVPALRKLTSRRL
jgi:hypothetical protein